MKISAFLKKLVAGLNEKLNPRAAFGADAAQWSPNRSFNFFPIHDPFADVTDWQREVIISRARSLYTNFPQVRHVVQTMVLLQGTLEPRPETADEEWNDLARRAFFARVLNPSTFDVSGRMDFFQAQEWIETRALVDGDSLTVCTRNSYDGEPKFRFYAAPQITERTTKSAVDIRNNSGVTLARDGRIKAFSVYDAFSDSTRTISAGQAILYGHHPSPVDPRHVSELVAAITTAQDIYEINAQHKAQIKIASQYAIVETKSDNDKNPSKSGFAASRLASRRALAAGVPVEQGSEPPLVVDGVKAITLSPGRDLKTLHNANPSNETRAFVNELVHALAYGLGIDPQVCFNPESLGSANARFILAKCRDVATRRNQDRRVWCNRVWQHVIAGEIAAGRLRPCREPRGMWFPKWINRAEWSIDLGRDANSEIALVESNLTNPDKWCLSHFGMTYEELGRKRVETMAALKKYADEKGVPFDVAFPSRAGSAATSWSSAPKDSNLEPTSENE